MAAGMVLFLLLGVFGSAVHYLASVTIDGDNALARLAGIAYALEFCSSMQTTTLSTWRLRRRFSFGIPGGSEPAGHPNETGRPKPHRNDGDCGFGLKIRTDISSPGKNGRRALCWRCW